MQLVCYKMQEMLLNLIVSEGYALLVLFYLLMMIKNLI